MASAGRSCFFRMTSSEGSGAAVAEIISATKIATATTVVFILTKPIPALLTLSARVMFTEGMQLESNVQSPQSAVPFRVQEFFGGTSGKPSGTRRSGRE